MDSEKKPKRPRIGSLNASIDSTDQENRYRPMSGDDHASTAEGQGDAASSASGYQPRQQGYQPYQRREGGYQPYQRREGGYQPRNNGYNRQNADQQGQGGYQPRQNHNGYGQPRQNQGYGNYNRQNNHNNGYGQQRQQGGYQPRQQGGYGQNQQGGYQPRQQGGYGQNQQGGYQPRQNQGGYQHQHKRGNSQPQHAGNQPRQNQGGYGQQRQQGGYQPRQNQGGYQQRGQQRPNQRGGYNQNRMNQPSRTFTPRPRQIEYQIEEIDPNAEIRLNKYMANAGICSRREADEHITNGKVKVNGNVVTELGVKITPKDVVEFDDKVVTPERKCYVLLNKPKDCVTTSDDPNGRLTVLDLVKNACRERIYPVGRLDRNTTGVLLLTNDGDLASKLTHPKFVKKKIYHVWTDKDIAEDDM
ncbi:MAG: RNA-binding S4 domain-containing protein, partial [Muribaculaceae bacterium]|nr:RNA-binding S4 domain-containing protein [Muribaculaceae bacterium]